MTLIELMVALAIVGLVTAGVLGVVSNLSHGQGDRRRELLAGRADAGLETLVRMDFLHAATLQRQGNGFSLTADAGLAENTRELVHLPCEIRYEIKTIAGRNWLLRYQKHTANPQEGELVEAVCADVKEIQIEVLDDAEANQQTEWESIPRSFVIYFVFMDTNRNPLSIAFHGPGV
ncbi:MAG: type II secretion system protein [Phycisphaerae bacterium]|nr:type II secretion system protein [Phycisphaerae bacterium]